MKSACSLGFLHQGRGRMLSGNRVCKTIHQYSKLPVPAGDMEKLLEIAGDCQKVRNYVYERFGGIGGLKKIYPGYTVQNDMTRSGLRGELGLPSVYFYLAVFDALGDIKSQWTRTKSKLFKLIAKNEGLSEEEKHYLRFLLKVNNAFEAVLSQHSFTLPGDMQKQYEHLAAAVDTEKLHRYLCRQVRKYHGKQHTDVADGFSLSMKAYRYEDGGIYIASKEKRKRIFISLTDNNQYDSQIYLKLYPQESRVEIKVPLEVRVREFAEYTGEVGAAWGMLSMLTTDEGHVYGEKLGSYLEEYGSWMQEQSRSYNRNRAQNPGRKKYRAKKARYEEHLHSYINHELNLFLQTEKPNCVYLPKLPRPGNGGVNKKINYAAAIWPRGYIRSRLMQKCREQSVKVVDVLGKNISRECSCCGAIGEKQKGWFSCKACGYQVLEKTNTARNAKKRGMGRNGNIGS